MLQISCLNGPTALMEYCCHVSAGASNCYWDMLHKPQKQVCRTVSILLDAPLESFLHCQSVTKKVFL